jgi:RNA polymerase sigma-70 factor (ECF subfamily)
MTLAKNKDVSEEITQKAFFKALATVKKHRGNSSELTWLCAIAKNLFIDEYRERRRFVALHADTVTQDGIQAVSQSTAPSVAQAAQVTASGSPADSIEKRFLDADSAFRIHQVLHDLEDPYKEVFQLRVFGELSFAKIALLFGKTESWARVTYHRARIKIQERMGSK